MKFGSRPVDIGDDEVVASFSVYSAPVLANQAHIFQYPLRSKHRPYESRDVKVFSTQARATDEEDSLPASKKKTSVFHSSSRVTMKCSLDTFGSVSFRPTRETSEDDDDCMEPQHQHEFSYTLQSQPFQPQSHYLLGYVTAEGIHLTPLSTIQQFTPVLNVPELSTGPVRVADDFCSHPNSNAMASFAAASRIQRELQRQRSSVLNEDANIAQEVQFFRFGTSESRGVRAQLRSPTLERTAAGPSVMVDSGRIENSLFPPEILQSGGITGGDEAFPSMIIQRFANRRPVAEQTSQLLQRCHVITLPLLKSTVVLHTSNEVARTISTVPEMQLVEALRMCAVYMHGVWVSRYCDQFRGPIAALRELVLARFYQSDDGSVTREELNTFVTTSAARRSMKEILSTISVLNTQEADPSKRRWRLKYVSCDPVLYGESLNAFKSEFPAEEASQHEAWKRRCTQVMSHIPYINANRAAPQLFLRQRGGASPTLAAPYGAAAAISSVTSSLGTAASSNAGVGNTVSTSPFTSPTSTGAEIRFKDADLVSIRNYIRELFAEHGVINKQRVKDLVIKAQEMRYPHATKAMLSSALQQCLDRFTDATWVLKSVGEPVVDYYRPAILSVILELRQFEMTALMRRVNEVVRERGLTSPPESVATRSRVSGTSAIPDWVMQRVVAEVAEFKAGGRLWHIKGGNMITD